MEISWLENLAESWRQRAEQGRLPHAVMLQGSTGVGKRCAAAWIARQRLGLDPGDLPEYPLSVPEHADLRWLAPLEDKHTIGVDQIRELVADLSLTSYEGGGKVAVLEPANAMTESAANSLLKTLEEPPGDALLVLIVDRTGRLPATVFSRCQRLQIAVPPESVSLAWLDRLQPGVNWSQALRAAGNAPLAAIEALERLDALQSLADDFEALTAKRASPLDVAAKWAKYEPAFVLDWLGRTVQQCIYSASAAATRAHGGVVAESVLRRIDRRNLFCYLDAINQLRSQPSGSFNVQLTLDALLIEWAGDLRDCDDASRFPSLGIDNKVNTG